MKRNRKSAPTGPQQKKQKQAQLNFQPVNRVITHQTDTGRSDSDTPPTISLTSPSPSGVPDSSDDTMIIDNRPITKPKQASSFMTTPGPTPDLDTPQPKPVKKQKRTQGTLARDAQLLAEEIRSVSDKGSETHEYAQLLDELVTTAGLREMKKFSIKQLTLMAKILLKRPTHAIEDADPRIETLTDTVREYLVASRPPSAPYVLPGNKKKNKQNVPTKQQVTDTSAWLDTVLPILQRDGFDEGDRLQWMRRNIDSLLTAIDRGTADSEWAELRGYIFQINQTLAARSRYLLRDVELPIVIPVSNKGRSVDSVELVFSRGEPEPALCFCEYKAYGTDQDPSKDLTESFQKQLDDYVSKLSQPDQPSHLRYVFPGQPPDWVFTKLRAAAEQLAAVGKRVYLTEGSSTRIVGKERELFTRSTKPTSTLTDDAPGPVTTTTPDDTTIVTSTPAVRPLKKTKSTPTARVKKKTPKKKKQQQEIAGQGNLNQFLSLTKVHTPATTPPPSGRPSSTSNVGSEHS
ncbi:hypothetical protein [Nonomuraea sp. JJY05]|uniref:hypothetical protein n=1 Tax=Nonomuraea sp. JJY05 TaxID=3350255 RepID=UPI00373E4ED8